MQYEFMDLETGDYLVIDMHPDEVCAIGESMSYIDGQVVRVPSVPATSMVRRNVAFVSRSEPRTWNGEGPDPAPRRDASGRPVFHNRREAVQYGHATGHPYDEL